MQHVQRLVGRDPNSVETCGTCRGSAWSTGVTQTPFGMMQTAVSCPGDAAAPGQTIKSPCNVCKGDGRVFGEETIEMDIPAGVHEGIQLFMAGKGNAGAKGGGAGDLLITVEEIPHEEFTRDGSNIMYELFINIADASLGTKRKCQPSMAAHVSLFRQARSRARFSD